MSLRKDLILLSSYFFILSTVLQAQDAFVYYYDFEYTPEKSTIKQNRGKILIAFGIFAIINYFTLVMAPYFNCSIRKLALISCAILIVKYGCELAAYAKIMKFIFELGSLFADIIGTALFYLTTLRIVQVMCDKHELKERTGLLFGVSAAIYSFSILIGSAIGYAFYKKTPTWLFLIFLASMTLISACIAYFLLGSTELPQEQSRENSNQQQADQNNQNQQNNEGAIAGIDAFRNNLNLGKILTFTFKTYSTIFPLFTVQTMLGVLFAYGYSLLQYLIWTSQTEQESDKLIHHKNTMVLYGFGGMVTSCLVGFICDKFTLRKLGYGLLIYNGLSMAFLYFAIYIKYYYTTLLLFMFLGMTQFALLTWLLSVCSRLYKGIFQVFAANAQVIAVAVSSYGMGVVFFEERINPGVKLSIELAGLLIINIFSFFFIRKLPSEVVVIDYLVEEQEGDSSEPNRDRQITEIRRENPAQIQMVNKKIQKSLEGQRTIDPQDLL